jgi:predicted amidohydrolase YtcJ
MMCRLCSALLLGMTAAVAAAPPPVDLVLLNAAIETLEPAQPRAEALAVSGDRIAALGSNEEISALAGPDTRVLDAGGKLVVPGFIEGHGHFMALGESQGTLDLRGARDWDAIVAQVREATAGAEQGEWILGRGWHQEKWSSVPRDTVDGVPLNTSLNAAAPHNPVLLEHASGHGYIANAAALALAGIDDMSADPPGGAIARDAAGVATGWLVDRAADLVLEAQSRAASTRAPAAQRAIYREWALGAGREALEKGITSFHDAGVPFATIDLYRELADAGELPVRMYAMVGYESNANLAANLARYREVGYANNFLTVRAIKRLADGALGSHSAWLLEPYDDEPQTMGLVVDSLAMIGETAQLALANGYQLNTHAIGDRANREVLDLYEQVWRGQENPRGLRWRIEHAQHLHADDVPRFAQLGVIASMHGVSATSDGSWMAKRLGEKRAGESSMLWRSLWDTGAVVTNGTDVPVEDIDPLASFYGSVTRRMTDGGTFHPEQCLTRVEALASYTRNNAWAAFEEDLKGRLAPGMLADFVVLSHDILRVPDAELLQARVLHTVLGGRIVYSRSAN